MMNNATETTLVNYFWFVLNGKNGFVTPVFFLSIFIQHWFIIPFKGWSSKNWRYKFNISKLKHGKCNLLSSMLHLWHEALFMILLYKWTCFEVQRIEKI